MASGKQSRQIYEKYGETDRYTRSPYFLFLYKKSPKNKGSLFPVLQRGYTEFLLKCIVKTDEPLKSGGIVHINYFLIRMEQKVRRIV